MEHQRQIDDTARRECGPAGTPSAVFEEYRSRITVSPYDRAGWHGVRVVEAGWRRPDGHRRWAPFTEFRVLAAHGTTVAAIEWERRAAAGPATAPPPPTGCSASWAGGPSGRTDAMLTWN